MKKLFVIVRQDLKPGAQLAQSNHATTAFALAHPFRFFWWAIFVKNIAVLSVPNEAALADLLALAERKGIQRAAFREPDFDDELTAISLGSGAERITSSLPLAPKQPKDCNEWGCVPYRC